MANTKRINSKIQNICKLTPMQEGMLFYKQMLSRDCYFVQNTVIISEKLDVEIIEQSFQLLGVEFSALRTMIVYRKVKHPQQVILKERVLETHVISGEDNNFKNQLETLAEKDQEQGFDLEKDSLVRLTILKGKVQTGLVWSFHHIIMDGWCLSILQNRFIENYDTLASGKPYNELKHARELSGKEIPGMEQYLKWRGRQQEEQALAYWKQLLVGYRESVMIPGDVSVSRRGQGIAKRKLSMDATERLRAFCKKRNVTISHVLETVCGVLLQMYRVDAGDAVFGKVVSGRNIPLSNMERAVGLFVNTIPVLSSDVTGKTWEEQMYAQKKQAIASDVYDFCSLSDIQKASECQGQLFDFLYVYENYYIPKSRNQGRHSFQIIHDTEGTNYGITLSAHMAETLSMKLMYDKEKYGDAQMQIVLAQVESLLLECVDTPTWKIQDHALSATEEKLIDKFNQTTLDVRKVSPVTLFQEKCQKMPKQLAVVAKDGSYTYEELNRLSDEIAQGILQTCHVSEGSILAFQIERGIRLVAVMLGIAKSGGCYLPVDASFPKERVDFILKDSGAVCFITEEVYEQLPLETANILLDDLIKKGRGSEPLKMPNVDIQLPIYCIYTSGTTGEPKGTLITHGNLSNLIQGQLQTHQIPERILASTRITFDVASQEIFLALANGGIILLTPNHLKNHVADFVNFAWKCRAEAMFVTPSYFDVLTEQEVDTERLLQNMRYVFLAGEPFYLNRVAETWARQHKCIFVNQYGPSETHCVTEEVVQDPAHATIGRPLANTQIHLLNRYGKPALLGAPGELCVTGMGVGLGYLNRPSLTEERFIQTSSGGRMYRTGDLARWLQDGRISYLGRSDTQVKINGIRVELSEIEKQMLNIDGVAQTVVAVERNSDHQQYLSAYYVSDKEIARETMLEHLGGTLPPYMLPKTFQRLEKIPLNSNGKIDRRHLPHIEFDVESSYRPPRDELESMVTEIFADVLGAEQVGMDDHFFELGGHSLSATLLINRLEKKLDVRLPVKALFDNPTPRLLCELIRRGNHGNYLPIPRAEEKSRYEMSSVQRRIYFASEMEKDSVLYNMPSLFAVTGRIDLFRLEQAFSALVARHEALRTTFSTENGQAWQEIHQEVLPKIEIIETENTGKDKLHGIMGSFVRPFDMTKAPLMRLGLVKENGQYPFLMVDMHHLITDGISMNVLLQDFLRLYQGENLEPLPLQYKDYSEWLRKRNHTQDKKYWKQVFKSVPEPLQLPLDGPREKIRSNSGKTLRGYTDARLRTRIREVAEKYSCTEYMVLLSALMIELGLYAGQEDITIGTSVSGRIHHDVERMVGMFVNTLVLRASPTGEKTFCDFLMEVRQRCLDAYEHQEYPYEDLINDVVRKRDLSRNPLFDVLFAFQNFEQTKLASSELSLEKVEWEKGTAKFDISVEIFDTGDQYSVSFEYCDRIFSEDSISWMLEHYLQILNDVVRDPACCIREIRYITEKEESFLRCAGTGKQLPYHKDSTIADLFLMQVKRVPDKIAVVDERRSLTYRELNQVSDRIGQELLKYQVGRGSYVAVAADHRVETVAAIFGILKIGAAYVPIDLSYPKERIQYMLKDCKPVVFCGGIDAEAYGTDVVHVESFLEGKKPEPVSVQVNADDLAYVIYTSGTTGKPKGVMVKHNGVALLREYFRDEFQAGEDDRVLQFASFSFDAALSELAMSLLSGGTLYIPGATIRKDPTLLQNYIENNEITLLVLPPQVLSQMKLTKPRAVITAGSETNARIVEDQRQIGCYSNDYGPTEATVFATHWTYRYDKHIPWKIPIGVPAPNKKIHLLQDTRPCGVGVPGEICISGDGLAAGYLNMQALTESRFQENVCGEGRLYRTGDLARWLPNGHLEFLGRIDRQVKIRGYRIELQEIEEVLRNFEGLSDAAVVSVRDVAGDDVLHAYYTADTDISATSLKAFLKQFLPDYMIPGSMMQIPSIPLTVNGKVAVQQLPAIHMSTEETYKEPVTQSEKLLAELYGEVLGIDMVGREDDFFELGGHSLKASKLIGLIENRTGIRLGVMALYEKPIVEDLAEVLDRELNVAASKTEEAYEMLPVTPAERAFIRLREKQKPGAFVSRGIYRHTGLLSEDQVNEAFQYVFGSKESLQKGYAHVGGEYICRKYRDLKLEMTFVALTNIEEEKQREIYLGCRHSFSLDQPPYVQGTMFYLTERDSVFVFEADILGCSGKELNVLVQQFFLRLNGKDWQDTLGVQVVRVPDLDERKQFWQTFHEKSWKNAILLPDRKQADGDSFLRERLEYSIRGLGRQGATEEQVLAACAIALYQLTEQANFVIGLYDRRGQASESGWDRIVPSRVAITHQTTLDQLGKAMHSSAEKTGAFLHETAEEVEEYLSDEEKRKEGAHLFFALDYDLSLYDLFQKKVCVLERMEETLLEDITLRYRGGEKLELLYNGAAYTADFMMAFLKRIGTLLLESTDTPVEALPLASKEEEQQILHLFNVDKEDMENWHSGTVLERFMMWTRTRGDQIALICGDKKMTFAELNARADCLADRLEAANIQKGDMVLVDSFHSMEYFVALLALWKLGAVCVPVETGKAENRLRMIQKDCNAHFLIASKANLARAISSGMEIIVSNGASATAQHVACHLDARDLAVLIYTSGSTGSPKGVPISHGAIRDMADSLHETCVVEPGERILSFMSYSFSASLMETALSFSVGGCLVIVEEEEQHQFSKIRELIIRQRCVYACIPPQICSFVAVPSLRYLVMIGSAVKTSYIDTFMENMYVVYGQTENCVFTSIEKITRESFATYRIQPIGKPAPGVRMYVMRGSKLCGIHMPGEICITGRRLFKGYLGEQAAHTIEVPFLNHETLFKTGDFGLWDEHGILHFIGRRDDQISYHGYRIEAGEIEHAFDRIEEVDESKVLAVETEEDIEIRAYVSVHGQVTAEELRRKIRQDLPEYMVPAAIVILKELPKNQSGKTDTVVLRNWAVHGKEVLETPVGDKETLVAELFGKILKYTSVSRNDDFYENGGNSIRTEQLIVALAEKGYEITLQEMEQGGTVKKIAEIMREMAEGSQQDDVRDEQTAWSATCTPIQKTFFSWHLERPDHFNQSVLLTNDTRIDEQAIHQILDGIMKAHPALHSRFLEKNQTFQLIHGTTPDAFQVYDLHSLSVIDAKREVKRIASHVQESFQTESGRLFHSVLFRLREKDYLFICVHHLIIDLESWKILLADLETGYGQYQMTGK